MREKVEVMVEEWLQVVSYQKELSFKSKSQDTNPYVGMCVCVCVYLSVCLFVFVCIYVCTCMCVYECVHPWLHAYIRHVVACVYFVCGIVFPLHILENEPRTAVVTIANCISRYMYMYVNQLKSLL